MLNYLGLTWLNLMQSTSIGIIGDFLVKCCKFKLSMRTDGVSLVICCYIYSTAYFDFSLFKKIALVLIGDS